MAQSSDLAASHRNDIPAERQRLSADQSGAPEASAVRSINAGLVSRRTEARQEALYDAVYYATFFQDLVNLQPTVRNLLEVAITDPEVPHRIMAVQALALIGDAEALLVLARSARNDSSPQVRRIVLNAVSEVSANRGGR
jgi:hypothetical protein